MPDLHTFHGGLKPGHSHYTSIQRMPKISLSLSLLFVRPPPAAKNQDAVLGKSADPAERERTIRRRELQDSAGRTRKKREEREGAAAETQKEKRGRGGEAAGLRSQSA